MTDTNTSLVLSDRTYNKVKQAAQIVLPGIGSLYFGLSTIWDLPAGEEVVGTTSLMTVFLGTLLGISSKQYKNSDVGYDGEMVVTEDGGGVKNFMLSLDKDPEDLKDMKSVSFKVQKNGTPEPHLPTEPHLP